MWMIASIVVIVALIGVIFWLGLGLHQAREDLEFSEHKAERLHEQAMSHMRRAHVWNREAVNLNALVQWWKRRHDAMHDKIHGSLLASNRSLKGWNGRYRRRIAGLEAEIADMKGEV